MAIRKTVNFKDNIDVSLFFVNQPPNLKLEIFTQEINNFHEELIPKKLPAVCDIYTIDDTNSDEEREEQKPDPLNFVDMEEICNVESHFLIYIESPGEEISEVIKALRKFFKDDDIQTLTVVRPTRKKEHGEDFRIGYEGVIVGVTFSETENSARYIVDDRQLRIPNLSSVKIIPGSRGEHIWKKYQVGKMFLQGFFFVGLDMVDIAPERLCYLCSFPKAYTHEYIKKEIQSHVEHEVVHIISNPFEQRSIVRLEFSKEEIVRMLIRRCMSFEGKPVLILPCKDRTPVEQIYMKHQVIVSGYTNAINPKEFIRMLTNSFGPLAELNINFEGFDSLVVFQQASAADICLRKKEIFVKNLKVKFSPATRPYRLTGLKLHKGFFNTATPERPLPILPASYSFEVPSDIEKKPLNA